MITIFIYLQDTYVYVYLFFNLRGVKQVKTCSVVKIKKNKLYDIMLQIKLTKTIVSL